jgi:subtilisin family serine protease
MRTGTQIEAILRRCALVSVLVAAVAPCAVAAPLERSSAAASSWPRATAVVGFRSEAALQAALRLGHARIVERIPALHAAAVRPAGSPARFARLAASLPGIRYVEPLQTRRRAAEPALAASPFAPGPWEWQYAATHADVVPASALRAAATITIAVVDTGADVAAPDLAAKSPSGYDARTGTSDVTDANGHGTFVATLAAGSVTNDEGVAGFGGDARLLVVRTASGEGQLTDVEEARAIVYAVDHGAKVINLSFGGTSTSTTERLAIEYALARDVLLVAAAGNEHDDGNPVEYPAALLQPEGSNGEGGAGLVVGASTPSGARASFSNTGSWISLAAPGEAVFSALSSLSSPAFYPRVLLPGSRIGFYGYGSGTSFAAPQVAGAAALVRAVAPNLSAPDTARVLEETAQGDVWTPELGFGVLDVAAAVARASELAGLRVPAASKLSLSASRSTGRAPLRIVLTAALSAPVPAGREVALETYDGRSWHRAARGTTGANGRIRWRLALRRGSYLVRARFGGADDVTAATSRSVRLQAR